MPLFKVSGELEKLAREVLRIQITVLGDCPQCGGSQYRSGVCEDCAYIAQEVLEAIQEWQLSQGMEPQQQTGVTASREVVEAFSQIIVMAKEKKKKDDKCPHCKSGLEHGINCRTCGYERPPRELDHHSPEFTGPSPDLIKNIKRKFIPSSTALEKIKQEKHKKHKKTKNKRSSFRYDNVKQSESTPNGIGTTLDDKSVVVTDPVAQIQEAIRGLAIKRFEDNRTEGASE